MHPIARRTPEPRSGAALVIGIIILVFIFGIVGWKVAENPAPSIQITSKLKGIGTSTTIQFEVRDTKYAIKQVEVTVEQNGQSFQAPFMETVFGEGSSSLWRFWVSPKENSWSVMAHAGRNEMPNLKQGRATLVITATNDSWGRFFRGGQSRVTLDVPVRFAPPQIQVLSSKHYVNQGGAELVVFKVSPGTTDSGAQVGPNYFPSFPVKDSMPDTRLCLFAYAYDVDPKTPARIVAQDDAGNQANGSFAYEVFSKKFQSDTIKLDDESMERIVPPIMSQTPELQDQGSLIKNYLQINGRLRQVDAQKLIELSKRTAPHFLWTQPFIELPAKVEASFAQYRTYVYNGQVVDHQTHLGFDLAGLQNMPIQAANDGFVVYASFLGIYGNAVVIDHGCGLQTLYGHMSSISVKPGDAVKRGQVIGRSGETGLAGGDHLHFTVLLDGIPVNPKEWWDPHWIHDRIEEKLAPFK